MKRLYIFWLPAVIIINLAGCASKLPSVNRSVSEDSLSSKPLNSGDSLSSKPLNSGESLSSTHLYYDELYARYAQKGYIVGIGEVAKTPDFLKDKRMAGILARLEIAKRIKVRIKSEIIERRCEGGNGSRLFNDSEECENKFNMLIEETVDEFLVGSRIMSYEERNGYIYAVAVQPQAEAIEEIDKNIKDSFQKSKEWIEKAKAGDRDRNSLQRAQEEYMKAVVYNQEREAIEGVQSRALDAFEELEIEIANLKKK